MPHFDRNPQTKRGDIYLRSKAGLVDTTDGSIKHPCWHFQHRLAQFIISANEDKGPRSIPLPFDC
jgi:hypothetical protein